MPEATRWIEHDDGVALEITAPGIDVARREAAEIETFLEDARTPQDQALPAGVNAWWVRVGFVLAFFTFPSALETCGDMHDLGSAPVAGALLFLVGASLLVWFVVIRALRRSLREGATHADTFTLRLDGEGFTFAGEKRAARRLPVDEIAAIEGGRRLVLVRPDGERLELPCELGDEETHLRLAARLDERRKRLRAEGGAYRGPRVAMPERVAGDDGRGEAEAGETREGRARRRGV